MDNLEKRIEVLFDLDKYEEVLPLAYENLYAKDIDKELLYNYIIISHLNLKEFKKALEVCDEALGEYPSSSVFFYLRSKNYFNISSYKNATKDIKEALELEPNFAKYLAHYAKILLFENELTQAKKTIEKALEIDANETEYHLTSAMILYVLDDEKMAHAIVDKVLEKEPHNISALDIKQKYFTKQLKEKKSILKNLLFLDPFDEENQKDIKFINYYYKLLPPLMVFVLSLTYLLQSSRKEFGFLEPFCFIGFAVLGTLGSKDWRLNIPFIATLVSFDAYYNLGSRGISVGEMFYIVFQAILFHFVFKGVFVLFKSFKYKFTTRLEQQQNNNRNPLIYFLFKAPFENYEVIDSKMMKHYYTIIPVLIVTTLLLIYIYMYHYEHLYFRVFLTLLFIYTGIKSFKVFWILVLYIFSVILITNSFQCDSCLWTLFASIFGAFAFVIPYNVTRKFL